MNERFGPWSSALGDGLVPHLSTFWKRRLALLASTRAAHLGVTRRDCLKLGTAGAAACALPTLHLASADGPDNGTTKGVGPVDRAATRERLKRLWHSLHTIEFCCDQYPLDAQGRFDRTEGSERVRVAIGTGGRRFVVESTVFNNEQYKITEMCTDGKQAYSFEYFAEHPTILDQVTITNVKGGVNEYNTGPLVGPLWSFMPFGKPLFQRLDDEATLDEYPDPDGGTYLVLTYKDKYGIVRCELDPQHDLLARRVERARNRHDLQGDAICPCQRPMDGGGGDGSGPYRASEGVPQGIRGDRFTDQSRARLGVQGRDTPRDDATRSHKNAIRYDQFRGGRGRSTGP